MPHLHLKRFRFASLLVLLAKTDLTSVRVHIYNAWHSAK